MVDSDGLVQDLGHLCRAGGCGAVLRSAAVPLSPAARARVMADPALLALVLTGGDDYELLFVAPPGADAMVEARAAAAGTPVTCVGDFIERAQAGEQEALVLGPDGAPLALPAGGWSHF
jgi:thiamine-monophosphate kinase